MLSEHFEMCGIATTVDQTFLKSRRSTDQCLCAVGWSGSGGLGAKEQGIQDPIKGGDIRDKWDQYKGVGVSLDDPYENYRRNKSYNFVARMKAREEGTFSLTLHLSSRIGNVATANFEYLQRTVHPVV